MLLEYRDSPAAVQDLFALVDWASEVCARSQGIVKQESTTAVVTDVILLSGAAFITCSREPDLVCGDALTRDGPICETSTVPFSAPGVHDVHITIAAGTFTGGPICSIARSTRLAAGEAKEKLWNSNATIHGH